MSNHMHAVNAANHLVDKFTQAKRMYFSFRDETKSLLEAIRSSQDEKQTVSLLKKLVHLARRERQTVDIFRKGIHEGYHLLHQLEKHEDLLLEDVKAALPHIEETFYVFEKHIVLLERRITHTLKLEKHLESEVRHHHHEHLQQLLTFVAEEEQEEKNLFAAVHSCEMSFTRLKNKFLTSSKTLKALAAFIIVGGTLPAAAVGIPPLMYGVMVIAVSIGVFAEQMDKRIPKDHVRTDFSTSNPFA